jgi:hypothetical protein
MVQLQRGIAHSQRLLRRVGAYATRVGVAQHAPGTCRTCSHADWSPAMQMPRPSYEGTARKLSA